MMKKENNENKIVTKPDKKQIVVGIIILIVAILLLVYGFKGYNIQTESTTQTENAAVENETTIAEEESADAIPEEKAHVFLTFTAATDKDVDYLISYTTEDEKYFNGKNAFTFPIKTGTAEYTIPFPVEKIVKFRIDFGMNSGKMTVTGFKLVGSQEEDISNPMFYEMMGRVRVGDNNSFVIEDENIPAIVYHPEFNPATKKAEAEQEAKADVKEVKTEVKEETKEAPEAETKEEVAVEPKAEEKAKATE